MYEHSAARARAEAKQVFRGSRDHRTASRVEAADAAQRAMEEKTARLRAARLARDAAAQGATVARRTAAAPAAERGG